MSDGRGDRLERVLSAQPWRVLRALRDGGELPADPILREGEVLDSAEYLTVCYELHRVVLPALADERLVEFDAVEDVVRSGARFDEVRPFLEQIDDDREPNVDP